jgi:hypothetical protein
MGIGGGGLRFVTIFYDTKYAINANVKMQKKKNKKKTQYAEICPEHFLC